MDKVELLLKKDEFLEYIRLKKRASENTLKSYGCDLDQLINFWTILHEKKSDLIISEVLQRYVNYLWAANKSSSSIARKISCLNSFKSFLVQQGFSINVKLKRPHIKQKEPQSLEIEDISKLLDSISFDELPTKSPLRDKAIVELLYATGICCSEIVQIEISNIDFKNKIIIIRIKNKKERTVIFGQKAFFKLKEYIENERTKLESPNEKLFLNHRNKPLTVRSIQRICKMFTQYLEDQQSLTPHKLRHSFATHMLINGIDIDTLQTLLGHKTRISTEKYLLKLNKRNNGNSF